MTAWKDYQEKSAAFFRSLGLTAITDDRILGVRGKHNIDVVVRNEMAGIGQLWIVECKKWKTRVTKLHVAALMEIVHDVGADRGILLSESGFQAGAIRIAQSSNITLSSLSDLEENSDSEKRRLDLYRLRWQVSRIRERIGALLVHEYPHEGSLHERYTRAVAGAKLEKILPLLGYAGGIEAALTAAEAGRGAVAYFEWDLENVRPRVTNTHGELLDGLMSGLIHLESELTKEEDSARQAGIDN
jgi:Restriction endonuclease